ncbi:hypothetical protein J6590_087938 [Homalodisca vitripennis]|nr:hypothetical protein J6590_087938 [Homalodisca vitripennis]
MLGIYVFWSLAKYCPSQILMMASYGLIYPHLTYGLVLWGACANNQFLRVFKLQKQAIRIIAQLKFREPCKEAFKNLPLLTLPSLHLGNNSVLGVQLIMEASFPAEQENPGNCLRPPMMREQQEARAPLLDLVSAEQQLKPAC